MAIPPIPPLPDSRPRLYLGLVATRLNIPSFVNASYQQMNFRRWFIARDDITVLQGALPNWYASNTVNEAGSGGTAQFTAAIERLDGSIQQVRWSGSTSSPVIANGGQTALWDALTLTTPIRRGEWFAVRGNGQFSAAIVLNSLNTSASSTQGDAIEFAASGLTDKTLSGTIGTNAGVTYGPCLLVAQTRRPSLALFGDSRLKGGVAAPGSDTADGSGDLGEVARSIGPNFAYVNTGTASETLQAFLTNNSRRLALAAYASHVICSYGINDFTAGRTQAQFLADVATFTALSAFAGKPVSWCTIGPRTTSTDSWVTLANQTVFAQEAIRVAVNDILRSRKIVGISDMFDVASAYESAINSGKHAIENGGQATTGDGLHLNYIGMQRIMDRKVFDPTRITR